MGPDNNPATSGPSSIFSDLNLTATAPTANVSNGSQVAQAPIAPSAIVKLDHTHSSIAKMKEPLDDTNWVVWRERIRCIFRLCGVEPYVYGNLPCPDLATDPARHTLWGSNDVYAQILITNNITKDQMVHVTRLNTAHEIWKSLVAIHETKDYQIAITIQRALFRKCASDGDDVEVLATKVG